MLHALRSLPRTIWLIGLISLLNDSASEMLYPLLPLFLASVLMAGPRALGLIEGLAEASSALLKLFSGLFFDRTGRAKPWLVWGYGLAAVGRPLLALVTSWPALLAIRLADRIGKGLRSSPRDALLASSVAPENRGLAFGLHRAMDHAGALIGPLVGAGLLAFGLPLEQVFLAAALPGALCIAFALAIREPEVLTEVKKSPRLEGSWHELSPLFRHYLVAVALFTLGNSSNMFLLLHARNLGQAAAEIPMLWATVSLVAMVLTTPLSALSDRLGRRRLLVLGYLAYGLFYLALAWQNSAGWHLYLLFATYGLFIAATEGVEKALVADLAPHDQRGKAFGFFHLVGGLMLFPASLIFGWLYQELSPQAAFLFSATCVAAAAILLLSLRPPQPTAT